VVLNEHAQVVLDRIQSGIVLHHATTEIINANAAATALLGVDRDNVTGATNSDPRWRFRRADDSPMPVDKYPVSIAICERNPLKNYIVGSLAAPHAWLASCGCSAMPRVDGRPNG
jgi:PAS domain-containing protein